MYSLGWKPHPESVLNKPLAIILFRSKALHSYHLSGKFAMSRFSSILRKQDIGSKSQMLFVAFQ